MINVFHLTKLLDPINALDETLLKHSECHGNPAWFHLRWLSPHDTKIL